VSKQELNLHKEDNCCDPVISEVRNRLIEEWDTKKAASWFAQFNVTL